MSKASCFIDATISALAPPYILTSFTSQTFFAMKLFEELSKSSYLCGTKKLTHRLQNGHTTPAPKSLLGCVTPARADKSEKLIILLE